MNIWVVPYSLPVIALTIIIEEVVYSEQNRSGGWLACIRL